MGGLLLFVCTVQASDRRADEEYVQHVYAAAMRSLSASESTFSSCSIDSDSEWEDTSRERQLISLLQEKDRSIRDLLAIAKRQEGELLQGRQREQSLRERVEVSERERAAIHQKYDAYDRYHVTLKRPLKYVNNTHFTTKSWLLTPEQRFGLANMVMQESGGLFEIKKVKK